MALMSTRDDSQRRRYLAQHSVAMLKQCCKYSKQCRNNVATLCCAKNRRYESPRVTSPLEWTVDCKTVRIFAYSSTREQSNISLE